MLCWIQRFATASSHLRSYKLMFIVESKLRSAWLSLEYFLKSEKYLCSYVGREWHLDVSTFFHFALVAIRKTSQNARTLLNSTLCFLSCHCVLPPLICQASSIHPWTQFPLFSHHIHLKNSYLCAHLPLTFSAAWFKKIVPPGLSKTILDSVLLDRFTAGATTRLQFLFWFF